jgi:hypothetical protein
MKYWQAKIRNIGRKGAMGFIQMIVIWCYILFRFDKKRLPIG